MWRELLLKVIRELGRPWRRLFDSTEESSAAGSEEVTGQARSARTQSRAGFWAELREGQREADARGLKGE